MKRWSRSLLANDEREAAELDVVCDTTFRRFPRASEAAIVAGHRLLVELTDYGFSDSDVRASRVKLDEARKRRRQLV